jgi:uncharacterized paraquat-inducible protein A
MASHFYIEEVLIHSCLLSSLANGDDCPTDHLRALRLCVRESHARQTPENPVHPLRRVLQRYNGLTLQQRLALTLTALMLWIFANFYPVMSISLKGLKNSATLWDSVMALSLGPITFIAMVAAIAMIIAPIFQLLLLIWVLGFALAGRRSPAFKFCMRWLETLRPWSMLEVCLLGQWSR